MVPARLYICKLALAVITFGLLATTATSAFAQEANTLRVRTLERDGRVLVTFSLDGGLTDEMKAVVSSGLSSEGGSTANWVPEGDILHLESGE